MTCSQCGRPVTTYRFWAIRFHEESTSRGRYRSWQIGPISGLRYSIDGEEGETVVLFGVWRLWEMRMSSPEVAK